MQLVYFLAGWVLGIVSTLAVVKLVLISAASALRKEQAKRDEKNELARARYSANPQAPFRSQARSLIRSVVNKEKEMWKFGVSTVDIIVSLESKFDGAMSFRNYGEVWEIDHVEPLKNFDLTDAGQFCRAISPSNLQPLFRGENQSKGSK